METELPSIEALDAAAQASGYSLWEWVRTNLNKAHVGRISVVAHARTLDQLWKHTGHPVDEAEMKRRQDAREASAQYCDAIGFTRTAEVNRSGAGDIDCCVQSAYIALCHEHKVQPIPVEEWGK